MEIYERYVPSGNGRRVGAFLMNAMFFGVLGMLSDKLSDGLGGIDSRQIMIILGLTAILASCLLPESMGKRIFNLKVLSSKKEELKFKKRFLRSSPYLGVLLSAALITFTRGFFQEVFHLVYMLSIGFLLINGLAVLFSKNMCSLMDLKLKTRVMTPPPLNDSLKPKILGMKVR